MASTEAMPLFKPLNQIFLPYPCMYEIVLGSLLVGMLAVDGFIEADCLADLVDFHGRKRIDDA